MRNQVFFLRHTLWCFVYVFLVICGCGNDEEEITQPLQEVQPPQVEQKPLPGEFRPLTEAEKQAIAEFRENPPRLYYEVSSISSAVIKIGEPALPVLLTFLNSENESLRSGTATVLGWIDSPLAVPALIERLQKDESPEVRLSIVHALRRINDHAIVPAIIEAAKDEDEDVRCAALTALGQLEDAAGVMRALIEALADKNPKVCVTASFALAVIGPPARAAIPALIRVINDLE